MPGIFTKLLKFQPVQNDIEYVLNNTENLQNAVYLVQKMCAISVEFGHFKIG